MKKLAMGILAHVDAGKTTLSESMLYISGSIRKLGRVDRGDAFLDTYELEKARGITIFSKQAILQVGDTTVTLLDTPGHVDFSAEMERTLQVMDYAILVISGADGVQGHTLTLWNLLSRYQVPVFVFINKMDQIGVDREKLLAEVQSRLDGSCVDFSSDVDQDEWKENVAMCEESALEQYLETGEIDQKQVVDMIAERKLFPCFFGSALKQEGVEEFLHGIMEYTREPHYGSTFGARVFKISRDNQGNRLTHMKITGGSLKVKSLLSGQGKTDAWEEKVNQIRIYSGEKYEMTDEASAGTVCAVTGLNHTFPGEGIGAEQNGELPILEPVLTYRICLPHDCEVHTMLLKLRQLEEEEPELHIVWNEQLGEIHAQVMGEVQIEILKSMILERYGVPVEFDAGNIVYKETIADTVEGVGHFEPLRHYAEVHLLLEPAERGTGLQFATDCSEDELDRNWQRLILTHLMEREHPGVLTGSPITDMKITLIAGRAHLKHTEGGDFRQSTYRAVRHGLKKAQSVLLEPYYAFRLEVPSDVVGRTMTDIQRMNGTFDTPQTEGEMTILTGSAPVVHMRDYQMELNTYSRGMGRMFCTLKGYEPCQNQEEIVEAIGYDSERDLENPTGSVFCAHGAGFVVPWYQVEDYMHIHTGVLDKKDTVGETQAYVPAYEPEPFIDEDELKEIFERTYGAGSGEKTSPYRRKRDYTTEAVTRRPGKPKKNKEYLLVDGYNIIFAWKELQELAEVDIGAARDKLMDILCDYQGYKKCTVILVFDAYKVEGGTGEVLKYHNIYVVYTKEAETADQYIEKTAHEIGRNYEVTVATSDGLEQVIIRGQGCRLLSARELQDEIRWVKQQIREEAAQHQTESGKNYLFDHMPEEMKQEMEKIRLGQGKEKNRR